MDFSLQLRSGIAGEGGQCYVHDLHVLLVCRVFLFGYEPVDLINGYVDSASIETGYHGAGFFCISR